jgi:ABC-type glycerol-3-phosphate transport system substrate-binding protein
MNKQLVSSSKKRFSRREFLSLASTMTAGALLAACQTVPAAPAQQAAPASENVEAQPPQAETIELIAWFTDRRSINEMTQEVAKSEFEEQNQGIVVDVQFVPEGEIQQKLLTSNAAGNAPDLSSIDETFLDTLTKNEVLLPIPGEIVNVKDKLGALSANLYDVEGKYYGLPNGVFSSQIYYNAALLDELGYTPEDIPKNWDDFLTWAKDITVWDGDNLELSGMAFWGNEFSMYEDLRIQFAGPIEGNFFPTESSIIHNDGPGNSAWQFIMDLFDVHKLDSKEEGLQSRERFGAGRAVTLYQWTWFNGIMDTQYTDIDWGMVLPPTLSGEAVYGRRGPDVGFTVTTQDDTHLNAAWTFYSYLFSPAYLARYCVLRGIQPSLKEMWDDPDFSAQSGSRWGVIAVKNRPENSVDFGFHPLELTDINNRILPAIRDEGEAISEVLQRVEDAGNEFLSANPQWSIQSREEYEAHPDWLTDQG